MERYIHTHIYTCVYIYNYLYTYYIYIFIFTCCAIQPKDLSFHVGDSYITLYAYLYIYIHRVVARYAWGGLYI